MALPLLFVAAKSEAQSNKVKPNYELAERFSPTKVGRMVRQTRVQPVWFQDGKQFIYAWSDTNERNFYIVDAVKGTKHELWDMDWLARSSVQMPCEGIPYPSPYHQAYRNITTQDRTSPRYICSPLSPNMGELLVFHRAQESIFRWHIQP